MRTCATIALLPAVLFAACDAESDLPGLGRPGEASLVASKLAILAVAIATGEEGRSFFDNFLPCARRGVIAYSNTAGGRRAELHGCDAGDGVVFDGTADVQWVQGGDRSRITTIDVTGDLEVTVGSASPAAVTDVRVTGVAFAAPTPGDPSRVQDLVTTGVRVTAFGATSALDAGVTPQTVLFPSLAPDAIPNPTGALATLTEADVRRITDHASMVLAGILLNETLEVQRGPHSHTTACGTMQVTIDATRNLPRLAMSWNACALGPGTFASGTFTLEWVDLAESPLRMSMVATGTLTLGGGLPTTTLSRLEWAVTGPAALPGTIQIAGRLVRGAESRAFSHSVLVDD